MRIYSGHALREIRERRRWRRELLAVRADCAATSIWKYEKGIRIPSGPTLARLADALDVEIDAFFTGGRGSDDAA